MWRESKRVMLASAAALLVFGPMIAEAWLSRVHEAALRGAGAIEPRGDVYRAMQVVYPTAFFAMLAEGAFRGAPADALTAAGACLFAAAKALKYWAIATLGVRWSFRVLVPRGSARRTDGPYRWLRHPNYLAVAGELLAVALAMHAPVTGIPSVVGFTWLMWRRVQVEERALAQ
jgi:methyltransferase